MSKPDFMTLVLELENCERDAHDAGLHETARAINKAVQKAGWERAAQVERERVRATQPTPSTWSEE